MLKSKIYNNFGTINLDIIPYICIVKTLIIRQIMTYGTFLPFNRQLTDYQAVILSASANRSR